MDAIPGPHSESPPTSSCFLQLALTETTGEPRFWSAGKGTADEVVVQSRLMEVLPRADVVALTCPLTPETEGMIGTAALAGMKPTAYLLNVARGRVVDEPALIKALNEGGIAGAALDCVWQEPLPAEFTAVVSRECFDHASYRR